MRWKLYSSEDIQYLHDHYSDQPVAETARALGRSVSSVGIKAISLGLTRDRRIKWRNPFLTQEVSPYDIGWTAGIIDGEGSLDIRGKGIMLRVGSIDRGMINKLVSLWGGTVGSKQKTSTGKTFYIWKLNPIRAGYVLEVVIPYLVTKRPKAKLCLKFRRLIKYEGRNQYYPRYTDEEIQEQEKVRSEFFALSPRRKRRGQ